MARFSQVEINALFFEGETGEYYIKVSEQSAWVYNMNDKKIHTDRAGTPMQCEFPENHQVEDI